MDVSGSRNTTGPIVDGWAQSDHLAASLYGSRLATAAAAGALDAQPQIVAVVQPDGSVQNVYVPADRVGGALQGAADADAQLWGWGIKAALVLGLLWFLISGLHLPVWPAIIAEVVIICSAFVLWERIRQGRQTP